jgi:hypothetical protein
MVRSPAAAAIAQGNKDAAQAKKTMSSNKHIIGKYSVLLKMLQEFDFTPEQCQTACKFVLKGVQH